MATDGYWDVITNDETGDLLSKMSDSSATEIAMAESLVLEARSVSSLVLNIGVFTQSNSSIV